MQFILKFRRENLFFRYRYLQKEMINLHNFSTNFSLPISITTRTFTPYLAIIHIITLSLQCCNLENVSCMTSDPEANSVYSKYAYQTSGSLMTMMKLSGNMSHNRDAWGEIHQFCTFADFNVRRFAPHTCSPRDRRYAKQVSLMVGVN